MRIISVLVFLLLLNGCATVSPVTWKERVEGAIGSDVGNSAGVNGEKQKKIQTSPIDLHYEEQGEGDVILMLHGFGESSFTWRYLVKDLAKKYRVIRLDLKGFGKSPKPKDGRYSIYDQAVVVNQFIKKHELNNITLVGHSLGGGVALALTLIAEKEAWQVDRLIVLDAAAYRQTLPSMMRQLKNPLVGNVGIHFVSPYYQARKAYEFSFFDNKKIPLEGVRESAQNFAQEGSRYVYVQSVRQLIPDDIESVSAQYKTIKQPTLVIWGYHDEVVSRRYARRLHRDINNSELKLIKRAGHMPHEERPKTVLKVMEAFLARNK